MGDQKPNHICKNINCTNGKDGNRKEYWACNDCDRLHSYREVACSTECYKEYVQQVLDSRSIKPIKKISVKQIKPIEEVEIAQDEIVDTKVL